MGRECPLFPGSPGVRASTRSGSYIGLGAAAPKIDYQKLERTAPALAGDLAFREFCIPRFSDYRTSDHAVLVNRARHHLRHAKFRRFSTMVGEVATYEFWPDGETVRGNILVVHGWTSEASFMMGLAEPLRRSGFRVVLLDFPAHGRSRGEHTRLVDCARGVVEICDHLGPFESVVAHSMGALAALMAGAGERPLSHPVAFGRYCLISPANRFSEVTGRFSQRLGISQAGRRQFERQLERVAHQSIGDFCGERFLRIVERPTLLIHARDDHEVSFQNSLQMADGMAQVKLVSFDGLGHRRILYAPPVVRSVVSFVREGAIA
jgi:pimeloyl-ACP methyl ester carboxylesterase